MQDVILYIVLGLLCVVVYLLLKQKSIGTHPKTQDDKTLGLIGRINES